MAASLGGAKKGKDNGGLRVLLSLACVVIVATGLKLASALFIPIMMGLFLAVLSLPILNWFDRWVPRPLAVLATVLMDFLILTMMVVIFANIFPDFQKKGKDYATQIRKQAVSFSEGFDQQVLRLSATWKGIGTEGSSQGEAQPEGDALPGDDGTNVAVPTIKLQDLVADYLDVNRVVSAIDQIDVVQRLTSITSKSFFAMVFMIFLLSESGRYGSKVKEVIRRRGPDLRRFQNSSRDIQKYLAIKSVASALTGLLAWLVCVIFKVDFPVLWGAVAFLLNYIPAIGSILAAIPPVLLCLIGNGFWPAAGVLACYLFINVMIGNFLEPMFLGERFGISTTVVILSVMVWGFIWGPVGMFLAVPLTMMTKVMLDNSEDLRWISVMMGKGSDTPKLPDKKKDADHELAEEAS